MALLKGGLQAALFDLDGVITRTAHLHAAAWQATFDDLLRRHAQDGASFQPFDKDREYRAYVDGKPRREGVRSFLRAREIVLSPGEEDQVAIAKDKMFEHLLREQGVQTFASTLTLIKALRARGTKVGVVTSSRHGSEILQAAAIATLFDTSLDGVDLERLGLKGKPDPDMFLRAVDTIGVSPARAVIFEDAVAGVQAGRRGEFGLVVGVDRGGNASALLLAGADVVVQDLADFRVQDLEQAYRTRQGEIAWRIEQEGFDLARESQMESIFTVGNGYLGVRGTLDSPLVSSQCDLFIAGIYDRKRIDLPYSEI